MQFASSIAELDFGIDQDSSVEEEKLFNEDEDESIGEEETKPNEAHSLSQENIASSSEEMNTASRSVRNLSTTSFPLLSSLGVHSNFMDKLLQRLVKFYGQKTIEYVGSNNCNGYLIFNRYDTELSNKGSDIDEMVNNVVKSSNVSEAVAAECLIHSLFNQFEQQFISVAIGSYLK